MRAHPNSLQVRPWLFHPASPSAPITRCTCPTASTSPCRSSTGMSRSAGAKIAIRTVHGEAVTYAELAERVNRAGNALLARGLKPGDRLLMVVKDCPAFFYLFWGAIKAGIVPVPPNTLLRAADYAYMFEDFGLRARRLFDRVRGRDRAGAEAGAGRGADGRRLPRRDGEGVAGARGTARGADRRLLLALLLRLDRPAQGRGPCPSRHGGDQRALRRARAGRRRERRLLFGGQAVLRLWARQRHDLPAVDRQHGDPRRPPADARHDLREHRALPADALFRRADALRRPARRARRQAAQARQHPRLRLGGRSRCRPTSSGGGRRRPAR